MKNIIITSPSLDPTQNVSGISSVTQFIIDNNKDCNYIHFELGRKDNERGGIFRITTILKCIILWWKLLSKHPDKIIHYNFPLSKASILRDPMFIAIARMRKRKIVVHLHGGMFLTADSIPSYLRLILNKVFAMEVPFIVLSDMEEKLVIEKFNCKNVAVLPNCIDLNDAETFNRAKNENEPLRLGYLGRIAETKGMDFLLEACVELKDKNVPFVLEIAGKEEVKGKYLPVFEEKLSDRFSFAGVVSGKSKSDYLKRLDIFVLPSFFEGLPMSLIECMNFGVVPVTTNVGSINEIVSDGSNGLYIEVKNSDSIVKQITKLHNDRDLLNSLSINAKNFVSLHFDTKKYIDKLNNIYNIA